MTRRVLQRLILSTAASFLETPPRRLAFSIKKEVTYIRAHLILSLFGQEWKPPSETRAERGARYSHLTECLKCVSWILASARKTPRLDPSPAILAPIATLGDLFCHLLNHGLQATATTGVMAPMFWVNGGYKKEDGACGMVS